MVSYGQQILRKALFKLSLGGKRRTGITRKTYARCNTKDMGVDRHHLTPPEHSTHNICRLATHTLQRL